MEWMLHISELQNGRNINSLQFIDRHHCEDVQNGRNINSLQFMYRHRCEDQSKQIWGQTKSDSVNNVL